MAEEAVTTGTAVGQFIVGAPLVGALSSDMRYDIQQPGQAQDQPLQEEALCLVEFYFVVSIALITCFTILGCNVLPE